MKYKFISDNHTHSKNSFDGNDSVMMMCERAASLGLYSITVTDHCECNEYYGNKDNIDYKKGDKDKVLSQSIREGSEITDNTTVSLIIGK